MAATQTTNNNSIRNEQKLHHLEEALPEAPPATVTAAVRNAYTRRVELKTMFQQQAEQELFETIKAFHACKQEEGQSVSTYVLKMKAYLDQIKRLGYPMPLTIPELHAMLKLAKKGIPKKTPTVLAIRQGQIQKPKLQARGKGKQRGMGKSKLAYDPKHKIAPPAKKEHPAKDTECIFTLELFSFPKSNTWIYDTGCGTHICNTIQGLRGYQKLNKGALDLYVGNGHSAAVEAIWSFKLILPSGMILVLDNFSKDNICYFNAFPRDCIFEIDMHNHISNERSIYTCSNKKTKHNLDSTFLWHCHLGHINKKCIEKLQHDGLLESIDDESFDVRVSCISGKMARKPFTYASERAKDLLGIIHSDVCRPFRTTSREGANYYVTFTDDFSRYVDLPPNCKTVESKWLFKKKTDMDGNIHTYKSRLVAKGFTQTYEVDYEETFSSVADIKAIRILIAIAAYYDYEIWQMDVKTAFLNGHLNEDVYMVQPEGFENPKYPRRTGFVIIMNGGTVDWKSSKQSTNAMSSMEAEYIAVVEAAMEAIWIRKFIFRLGVVPSIDKRMDMYCDNICAITIADEPGVQKDNNLVDPFTKPMPCTKHVEHARSIGLRPASSFM
ncbi:retrotransposon protein, putative, ty1-copia subclass, partial [Tanacetum coccineum]